jgi:short-subunit dehydrogenase
LCDCIYFSFRANAGIGKELATYAAAKGAKVYMLCRTFERAKKAKEEIIQSTNNENISIIQVSKFVFHF